MPASPQATYATDMSTEKQPTEGEKHEFEEMPEFDEAMRRIVSVPKEVVEKKADDESAGQ